MILGMTTANFTILHVLISLVGIGSGLVVMYGFFTANRLDRWTALFLTTTAFTSLTGFLFPNEHITPGIVIGILSMIVLIVASAARYALHMNGIWRPIYVVSAAIALYFNVFVLVVQSIEKTPALKALVPTQQPPFGPEQLPVLVLFVIATIFCVKRFRPDSAIAKTVSSAGQKRAA